MPEKTDPYLTAAPPPTQSRSKLPQDISGVVLYKLSFAVLYEPSA
jgi:hypothetical protein